MPTITPAIGLAILAALLAMAYGKGRIDEQQVTQARQTVASLAAYKSAAKAERQHLQDAAVLQENFRVTEKQVVRYVEKRVPVCSFDAEWVRIYNNAISGGDVAAPTENANIDDAGE